MKLLIVSHTPHYRDAGRILAWEPTAEEINHISTLFDEIRHIAWLHDEPPPAAVIPYASEKISFIPVSPSGGPGLRNKLKILTAAPQYFSAIRDNARWADIVHVRCPSNIALMAIFMLMFRKRPEFRWIKYATNWSPQSKEPWSYTLQRWLLKKNFHRGIVTVNGEWPQQPSHVCPFYNPSLDQNYLLSKPYTHRQLQPPYRFIHVGRLVEQKGIGNAVEILSHLKRKKIEFWFDVVGDGDRIRFEQKVQALGLQDCVRFHGWLDRASLNTLYQECHFILFPSRSSEGWPKVLSEAMAHGVVPIAGAISSIPQILDNFKTGTTRSLCDPLEFVEAIMMYLNNPQKWAKESLNGQSAAMHFTYSSYIERLRNTFQCAWGITQTRTDHPLNI